MRIKFLIVLLLGCLTITGCQGRVGTLRSLPVERQQAVLAMLKAGSYDVHQCPGAVIIKPKNMNTSLEIIGSRCHTLEEEDGSFDGVQLYPETGLREIVHPKGQVLGFVSYDLQRTKVGIGMDGNGAVRLYVTRRHSGR